MHSADYYFSQVAHGTPQTEYQIPEDWGQGRAGFGGLVAGMMIMSMRRIVPNEQILLSFSCNFAGPVLLNTPFRIETRLLRTGKNTTQVQAEIIQLHKDIPSTPTILFASFGVLRSSNANMTARPLPEHYQKPEHYKDMPFIAKLTPNFFQHVQSRLAEGAYPFTGKGGRFLGGWWRWHSHKQAHDTSTRTGTAHHYNEANLVALIDAWPPAVLPLIEGFAPASTMTWTVHFTQPIPNVMGDWLCYQACIEAAHAGYGQTSAAIWNTSGQLLASSNQLVAVFDNIEKSLATRIITPLALNLIQGWFKLK